MSECRDNLFINAFMNILLFNYSIKIMIRTAFVFHVNERVPAFVHEIMRCVFGPAFASRVASARLAFLACACVHTHTRRCCEFVCGVLFCRIIHTVRAHPRPSLRCKARGHRQSGLAGISISLLNANWRATTRNRRVAAAWPGHKAVRLSIENNNSAPLNICVCHRTRGSRAD